MSAGAFRTAGLQARNIPLDTQSTWAVLVGTLPKSALQLAFTRARYLLTQPCKVA